MILQPSLHVSMCVCVLTFNCCTYCYCTCSPKFHMNNICIAYICTAQCNFHFDVINKYLQILSSWLPLFYYSFQPSIHFVSFEFCIEKNFSLENYEINTFIEQYYVLISYSRPWEYFYIIWSCMQSHFWLKHFSVVFEQAMCTCVCVCSFYSKWNNN